MDTLVVSPDPDVLRQLETALSRHGHTVTARSETNPAWQAARSGCYHLAVIDAALAPWRGDDGAPRLCRYLLGRPSELAPVVVAVVSPDDPAGFYAMAEAGAARFLLKPLDPATLSDQLLRAERLTVANAQDAATLVALQESERRFRAIFERAAIGIAIVEIEGYIAECNPAFQELIGYSAEELRALTFVDFTHPDDIRADQTLFDEMLAGKRTSYEMEKRYIRKDGAVVWVRLTASLIRAANGEPRYALGMVEDISERKRAETERRTLASIVESSNDAIVGHTLDGIILSWNEGAARIYGYRRDEAIGRPISMLVAPADEQESLLAESEWSDDRIDHSEAVHLTKNGQRVPVSLTISAVYGDDGEVIAASMIARDITERRRAEQELFETNEKLRDRVAELQQRTREISLLNELGDLLQACRTPTEAYSVVTQLSPALFPGLTVQLLVRDRADRLLRLGSASDAAPAAAALLTADDCWALRRGRPHIVTDTSGGLVCAHLAGRPPAAYLCLPLMVQGEHIGVLSLTAAAAGDLSDSTHWLAGAVAEQIALSLSNLHLQETLRMQSIRDPLTNLFNRRHLDEVFERELRRAIEQDQPLAVMMADIDHFKRVNDTHGHDAGDSVLRQVGAVLLAQARPGEIVCRFGGEEFLLVLPGTTCVEAEHRAEALRLAVRQQRPRDRDVALPSVSLSFGVAAFPHHGSTTEALIRAADAALYQAKAAGRNRVAVAS
jgi:diguanylate cyclase (GGDEF)-like protein/PAS domain S-box-containing protein